jgi:hypothetical protein
VLSSLGFPIVGIVLGSLAPEAINLSDASVTFAARWIPPVSGLAAQVGGEATQTNRIILSQATNVMYAMLIWMAFTVSIHLLLLFVRGRSTSKLNLVGAIALTKPRFQWAVIVFDCIVIPSICLALASDRDLFVRSGIIHGFPFWWTKLAFLMIGSTCGLMAGMDPLYCVIAKNHDVGE